MRLGVAVLIYHAVDPEIGSRAATYSVLPAQLAAQMALLARHGWRCLALDTVHRALQRRESLPRRAFALTFDDGYDDLESRVEPVLARHGFPATVFVVTGRLGQRWTDGDGDPPRRLLAPDAIRRLDGPLVRFESHSCTHPDLTRVARSSAWCEIAESRRDLEEVLGREVTTFAYPHGKFDREIEALVRDAGYRAAATTIAGPNRRGTDPFRIRRVTIRARDTLASFVFKLWTGHGFRSAARALAGIGTGGPAANAPTHRMDRLP